MIAPNYDGKYRCSRVYVASSLEAFDDVAVVDWFLPPRRLLFPPSLRRL